jgi:membrane protein YqaA with SNARE-associated domain
LAARGGRPAHGRPGTLRVNLAAFTILVATGKAVRYAAVTTAMLGRM